MEEGGSFQVRKRDKEWGWILERVGKREGVAFLPAGVSERKTVWGARARWTQNLIIKPKLINYLVCSAAYRQGKARQVGVERSKFFKKKKKKPCIWLLPLSVRIFQESFHRPVIILVRV